MQAMALDDMAAETAMKALSRIEAHLPSKWIEHDRRTSLLFGTHHGEDDGSVKIEAEIKGPGAHATLRLFASSRNEKDDWSHQLDIVGLPSDIVNRRDFGSKIIAGIDAVCQAVRACTDDDALDPRDCEATAPIAKRALRHAEALAAERYAMNGVKDVWEQVWVRTGHGDAPATVTMGSEGSGPCEIDLPSIAWVQVTAFGSSCSIHLGGLVGATTTSRNADDPIASMRLLSQLRAERLTRADASNKSPAEASAE
jgi:hypothetical protein